MYYKITMGVQLTFDSNQVKQAIFLKQLEVTNLKLTSDGRLIDSNNGESEKINGYDNISLEKIRQLKCYELEQINSIKLLELVARASGHKLQKIDLPISKFSKIGSLYSIGALPIIINYKNCEASEECTELIKNKSCDKNSYPFDFDKPARDLTYINMRCGQFNDYPIHNGEDIINIVDIYKNAIKDFNISYSDVANRLSRIISKLTDVGNKALGDNLELHISQGLSTLGMESYQVKFDIKFVEATRNPHILDNVIFMDIITVYLYVTNKGYEIAIYGYMHSPNRIYEGGYKHFSSDRGKQGIKPVIPFNGDLEKSMKEIEEIINSEFKQSMKEAKEVRKQLLS